MLLRLIIFDLDGTLVDNEVFKKEVLMTLPCENFSCE